MKNFFALLIVSSFAFAIVRCGGKKVREAAKNSDTAKVEIDTIAQKVDSAIQAIVDSAKTKVR